MKKTVTFLSVIFLSLVSLFADERFFSFSFGLSSGVPVYQSEDLLEKMNDFSGKDNRFIIGGLATANLNITEKATVFCGTDLLVDFNWDKYERCHVLTWDFNTGIKIYPGLGGFDLGLAYVLGYRSDYYGLKGHNQTTYRDPTPWGNGFKFLMEYNFAHKGNSRFLPTVGIFWKNMPRGNYTKDNQVCAYLCLNL